jgi:hypothetical protein
MRELFKGILPPRERVGVRGKYPVRFAELGIM